MDLQSEAIIVIATEIVEQVDQEAANAVIVQSVTKAIGNSHEWSTYQADKTTCKKIINEIKYDKIQQVKKIIQLVNNNNTNNNKYGQQKRKLYKSVATLKRLALENSISVQDWEVFQKNIYGDLERRQKVPVTFTL